MSTLLCIAAILAGGVVGVAGLVAVLVGFFGGLLPLPLVLFGWLDSPSEWRVTVAAWPIMIITTALAGAIAYFGGTWALAFHTGCATAGIVLGVMGAIVMGVQLKAL